MTTPFVIDPNQVNDSGGQMGTQADQFGAGGASAGPSGQLPTQQAAAAALAAEQADRRQLGDGVAQTGDQTQQAAGAYGGTETSSAHQLSSSEIKDYTGTMSSLFKDGTSALSAFLSPLSSAAGALTSGGASAASAAASAASTVGGQMAQTEAKIHPEHFSAAAPDANAKTDAAAPAAASGQDNKQSDDKQKGQ